jgi:hypothetical protein
MKKANLDPVPISKRDAEDLLVLDTKVFDNFFKNADEFGPLPRGSGERYLFDKRELEKWLESYRWRTVMLDRDDYRLCLDFALAMHFRGYVISDWGTGRQREFGQKLTNWIKGQLAEVAVKKFFLSKFSFNVELDFGLHEEIVPQDIVAVLQPDGSKRKPNLNVGVKSSKPKSAYLVLGPNEVELENRRSDAYIFCRPDLPDDHLLRITKEQIIKEVEKQQHYPKYKSEIPDLEPMPCEIAGWCWRKELEKVTEIEGQEFDSYRYVKKSGRLHRTKEDWQNLLRRI